MAASSTFGSAEMVVRRDILNDNYVGNYRWGVLQVMKALNDAVLDVVKLNSMAGYDQDTLDPIPHNVLNTANIDNYCKGSVDQQAINESNESARTSMLRNTMIPIDSHWFNAVVYIAAAKLLEIDDSDTSNAQKAAQLFATGKEYAIS